MKVRRKVMALLIAVSFVGAIFGSYVGASSPDYKMGAILISPQQYSKITGTTFKPLTKSAYEHLVQIAPSYPRVPSVSKDSLYALASSPLSSSTSSTLPSSVNNSLYLPPIGNQGHVGSCNAWSSTYYVYTYMINWFRGHEHPTGNYIMNPTFTYNLINNGSDAGSVPEDAMTLISTVGAVPLGDFPLYNASETSDMPSDYAYLWPNETQWKEAMVNKGSPAMYNSIWTSSTFGSYDGTIYVVNLSNTTQFNYLKGLLAAGYIAQTAINVYSNFFNFDANNDIYALNSVNNWDSYEGGHAVTIVGYNDNLNTPDGKGAFLMVNSWGTGWGDNGYWWLTYPAAMGEKNGYGQQLGQGDAYIYVPESKTPRKPEIYSVFHITHSKRGEIIGGIYDSTTYVVTKHAGIELGAGSNQSPIWKRWFFNLYIGYSSSSSYLGRYQAYPFPNSPIALDLSDSISSLNSDVDSQYVPFFIHLADKYQDGVTGTLDSFEVVVNSTYIHRIIKATGTPKSIPENGNWLTLSVNVPVVDYTGMTPIQGAVLHTNWAYIDVGSLVNMSSATLTLNGKQYTMKEGSSTHFYYNATGLSNGTYTYSVSVTFHDGKTVTLPQRTFKVNTGKVSSYVPLGPSSWVSMVTVAPGDTKYTNGTFVWKNAANGEASPFTGTKYHLTGMEAKYDSTDGMLLLKVGVSLLDNLGSIPSSLLNVSIDTNGDGKWDYHAVVDLAKPGTKAGIANIMDLYNANGTNIANSQTLFIPDPSTSTVYMQIPANLIGISGQDSINVRVQLYEHDDIYGPLDTLTTSSGGTTATLNLTQVPMFSNVDLIGLVVLLGALLFWRRYP